MTKRTDLSSLVGQTFNGIAVLAEHGRTPAHKRTWCCRCHCGKEFIAVGGNLKSGMTKSCGCIGRTKASARMASLNPTHGKTGTPTYRSWAAMLSRCRNPNATGAHRYSERGISICDRWSDFANFLADMGDRPEGKTLDRFPDPDGNYEPGNCRWATPAEQNANKGSK